MPGLAAYQRIVIRGRGPGSEIWQTGFATVVTTPITSQAGLQSYLNSMTSLIQAWFTSVKTNMHQSYSIQDCVAYQYQAPSTRAQFQAQASLTLAVGSISAGGSPIDTAAVVSLRTAVPGRRTRGRMYVPCHANVLSTTGNFNSVVTNGIGTATKTLMSGILTGTSGGPAVVSRTGGTYELLSSLVTDTKPDVQRRRENRLAPDSVQTLTFP